MSGAPPDDETADALDDLAMDGDTPPHGVPPVVVEGPQRVRVTRNRVPRSPGPGRVYAPRRRRGRLTRRGRLLVAVVVLVAVLAGAFGWYESQANPFGAKGPAVVVDVHQGESAGSIYAALTHAGVVGSSIAFRFWTLVHGAPTIRPGRYLLHRNLRFSTVSSLLESGPNVYELDVAPGNTLSEIAGELSSLPGTLPHEFLTEAKQGAVRSPFQPVPGGSLEGLIAPGTYQVVPGETAHQLLEEMVTRFGAEAKAAGLSAATSVQGLAPYQVVTLASIAQKEGYFERYFGDVARVIYNRLGAGMALDMTSTVLYSLGRDGGTVTPAEEQLTTPYNTYLHHGLTPTPICTPSERALAAAVSAPSGSWLYFDLVTPKKGVMVFSSTYSGQVAAQQEAAANAAAHASSTSVTSGVPST